MARKGRVKSITHTATDEEENDFQNLKIEGTKTTAQPGKKGDSNNGKRSH